MEGLRKVLEDLQTSKGRDVRTRDGETESGQVNEETSKGVAEFDARLSALEKSLGLASLDGGAPETPLLPSLALLDRQFGALMNASSLASLEAASVRIRKLNVTAVTGTLRSLETASRAVVVAELTQLRSVESTGHRVEEGIECGGSGNAFRRESANVLGGQEAEGHASDVAAHGLRDVHCVWCMWR
jgi:hypothetical protein